VAGNDVRRAKVRKAAAALAPHFAVVLLLLALSIGMWWHVWVTGHPSFTVLCECGDPGQAVWFMAWVPWALTHGHNPFLTGEIFAGQGGANLLDSTSYLLPSFVMAPLTWLSGPTVSFNVVETLAPVLSGWCMFIAARRVTRSWVAGAVAAVLWGFSPFIGSALEFGHLNFALLFFPPLVFVLVFDLVTTDRRPALLGVDLCLLSIAQFFSGTEPLAIFAIGALVAAIAAVAMAPRAFWRCRRRLALAGAVALVGTAVVLAYPVWFLLAGPRHIVGQPWPATPFLGARLSDTLNPGSGTHAASPFSEIGGYYGRPGPGTSYLGLPLLVGLAISVPLWWRQHLAWALVITGGAAWLCSLGALLMPLSAHSSQWWLPWQYLQHLPLLQSIGPSRLALVVDLVAAMLLAICLDGWVSFGRKARERIPAKLAAGRNVAAIATGVVLAVAVGFAALPIVRSDTWPLTMNASAAPAWFVSAALHLAPGTRVLTYPYTSSVSDTMYWQAADGFSFSLVGGRAEIPGADGRHSQHVDSLTGTDAVLVDASFGFGLPDAPDRATLVGIRRSLQKWGVEVVVIVRTGRAPAWAAAVFTAALGRLPRLRDGVLVWNHADEPGLPIVVTPSAIERCSGAGLDLASFEAAPGCTLRSRLPENEK
jgi:hypothetical protein